MGGDEWKLLNQIKLEQAVIQEQLRHVPSAEEYSAFKSRVMAVGTCLVLGSGVLGFLISLGVMMYMAKR